MSMCALQIDYTQCKPQVMMEGTGVHLTRTTLQYCFDAGMDKVVVSAPVKEPTDPVLNIVVGCNEVRSHLAVPKSRDQGSGAPGACAQVCRNVCAKSFRHLSLPRNRPVIRSRLRLHQVNAWRDRVQGLYDAAKDHIVTAASCTTNCLAPVVKVIHENLKIVKGAITTIHCVTNTQTIIDAPNAKKADLRRARSGLMNLAPTSTGSATAIALIFPDLKGKLNGVPSCLAGNSTCICIRAVFPAMHAGWAVLLIAALLGK